jgi:hypothetical protein
VFWFTKTHSFVIIYTIEIRLILFTHLNGRETIKHIRLTIQAAEKSEPSEGLRRGLILHVFARSNAKDHEEVARTAES